MGIDSLCRGPIKLVHRIRGDELVVSWIYRNASGRDWTLVRHGQAEGEYRGIAGGRDHDDGMSAIDGKVILQAESVNNAISSTLYTEAARNARACVAHVARRACIAIEHLGGLLNASHVAIEVEHHVFELAKVLACETKGGHEKNLRFGPIPL